MIGPREAVNTAMLAAAVGIDAGVETNIRAVVVGYDGAGRVFQELGPRQRILIRIAISIGFEMESLEPVRRVSSSAATGKRFGFHAEHTLSYLPKSAARYLSEEKMSGLKGNAALAG